MVLSEAEALCLGLMKSDRDDVATWTLTELMMNLTDSYDEDGWGGIMERWGLTLPEIKDLVAVGRNT